MNWTIEQLRAFVAAAEKGSFSAAGRALGKAQSVVSTHIATLEDELGVTLFDRSSRSPVLTEAGHALLPEAHAVIRQSHRFDSCAIAQYKGDAAKLDISISHCVPFQIISESIAALSRKYAFLGGSFHVKSSETVWREVEEGQTHIGLVLGELPNFNRSCCDVACLGQMRHCLVASRSSPLGQKRNVTAEDLAQHRQIVFSSAESQRFLLNAQYWEVNDVLAAVYWASLGIGWTVVPQSLVRRITQEGDNMRNLVMLNMEKMARITSNIYLVWNLKFSQTEVLEYLCEDLKARYQKNYSSDKSMF